MTIYQPGQTWNTGEFAAILAIGDSWFWYPKNNLLTALVSNPHLQEPYKNIQMLGYNGAELKEYVFGKYAPEFQRELEPINSHYYSAVLVSGAGNDAIDYGLPLKKNCAGAVNAAQCFDATGLDTLLRGVSRALGALIHDVAWSVAKQSRNKPLDIFIHGYDYVVPDGRGFGLPGITVTGPWFKPAFDRAQVADDLTLRKNICTILIDRLNALFAQYDGLSGTNYLIHYIDCRNTLKSDSHYKDDWANEFHPTTRGFDTLVAKKWIPVLQTFGYTK